ncbi:hypothetical protein KIN20_024680 [Parelaphostrongylus tenuis]|uniref:Uncharacterized protein n=1 Tax=Parelaphostrongylus tenuis TaxID=148309 RepID=A0AAD5QTT4_PARTN|nr:hypothetical protein KIN20_024680 [Parelaphostrongylus tenuis]
MPDYSEKVSRDGNFLRKTGNQVKTFDRLSIESHRQKLLRGSATRTVKISIT